MIGKKGRRWLAGLLVCCLSVQTWLSAEIPALASAAPMQTGKTAEIKDSLGEGKIQTESALEVQVRSSLLFPFQDKVTIQICNAGKTIEESRQIDCDTEGASVRFDVPQGEYTLTVRTERFAAYTQTVSVRKGWISKVEVCPVRTETGSDAVPGWIRPGDFNGDQSIDQQDTEKLLSVLRANPDSTDTDLNGDGATDIADLQNLVQSMDEEQLSHIEKLGIPKGLRAVEGTFADGDMTDFLNHTGNIKLKPLDTESSISTDNPVGLEFTLVEEETKEPFIPQIQGIVLHTSVGDSEGEVPASDITEGEAVVVYTDEQGEEQEIVYSLSEQQSRSGIRTKAVRLSSGASVTTETDGSLVLDFGTQLAVKRVRIRITGTRKTEPLVTIANVEFVNSMEDRIPAPQLDIPVLQTPVSGDESLMVSWNAQRNVTGYEVSVTGPVKGQTAIESQVVRVANTQHRISSINDKSLKNYGRYTIRVRSVNGDWKSPWSEEKTGEPRPQSLPAPPDNVRAEGGYRSITVTWKDMEDTRGYMVYYKKKKDSSSYQPVVDGFQPVREGSGRLADNRYVITGLADHEEYAVYVIGWNELGWSKASLVSTAVTRSTAPPQLPKYKLLNTSNGEGVLSSHIVSATAGGSGGAVMVGSPLDTAEGSALGLVDDNYASYWSKEDWDDGVMYPSSSKGVVLTLDKEYKMNYMTLAAADQKYGLDSVRIGYWNEDKPGTEQIAGARLLQKTDVDNNPYYIVKFDQTIKTDKIHLCLARSWGGARGMMIGEIHFHQYDSLEDDIMGLYTDDMHTTLRSDVTADTIREYEERLNQPDEISGERHPLYDELMLELKTAKEILTASLDPSFEVNNQITAKKDTHLGFGGLNAWQPLGKVARAGESLLVYVGHNTKRTGDAAELQLIMTQYHAESGSVAKTINLKVGRNEITVPQISSLDFERGGPLYIAYTGNSSLDQYAVRIGGGSRIPVLNVYGKTGSQRTEAIRTYVAELEAYVKTLETEHEKQHSGTKNTDYAYDPLNCILDTTDIMMEEMMYSVPAVQVWAGIRNADDKVTKLDRALQAMEKTMTLFYQHKGLSDEAGTDRGNNALPSQHLNIRYMRMFAGAFMYAAGNHIGVEWNSTLLASAPDDWSGFGWGVAHEIGHNINQGCYAIAEITNNYFAQLLTKTPGKTRFTYSNVYKKVTSGAKGRSSNVATQLALYWQLHLAYDNNTEDRYIYDKYEDLFDNLFFARVDTYARNPKKAPCAGLLLNGDADQNLMRLACAAANKNILPFFERWGMVPDAVTAAYAGKYGLAETKALYYVNEDARDYRIAHPDEDGTVKDQDVVRASVTAKSNQVTITMTSEGDAERILGYEISRSCISHGRKETEVIGFQPAASGSQTDYVDRVSSIDNRVMEYEVRAVDKYLNYSNPASAGSVKIQTDGVLEKEMWTVETTMTSDDDIAIEPDREDPDSGYDAGAPDSIAEKRQHTIDRILDGDVTPTGTYHGRCTDTAAITIDMHKTEPVTALKYTGDMPSGLSVAVSRDGETWITVRETVRSDEFVSHTIWFDSVKEEAREDWIGTYDARYVRLSIQHEGPLSIQEIELCGPSGDNMEFMSTESGQPAIGVLSADFKYGSQASDVIRKGSLILTGTYKGNPAYNVVVLYDTQGNVIGARDGNVEAGQVILADVPEQGNLGETSRGTWVYYLEPGQWDADTLKEIQGVRGELYRVDDALTLEGERVVSDTQVIPIPAVIPEITLKGKGD